MERSRYSRIEIAIREAALLEAVELGADRGGDYPRTFQPFRFIGGLVYRAAERKTECYQNRKIGASQHGPGNSSKEGAEPIGGGSRHGSDFALGLLRAYQTFLLQLRTQRGPNPLGRFRFQLIP